MLLWQLKNVRNRHLVWLKLFACSFIAHLLFVGVFFFGYRDSAKSHTFTMHNHSINTHVAVVLVTNVQKATAQPVATQKTNAHKNISTNIKVPTQIAPTKTVPPKVAPKKAAPAKKTVKAPAKKAEPVKKPAQIKPSPTAAKASTDRPAKIEKPIPTPVQPKTVPEPLKPQEVISQPVAKQQVEQSIDNGVVTVEVPYSQAREFYQQEALRKELSRHWKPPHGMPDTCSCEITTYVGNNGTVTDSIITQSSGILMYDVSARAAILAMELPRWTWGSSFTITFKP